MSRLESAPRGADKRYLNVHELAAYLGVSRWSLYKLVQRRRIPFIPIVIDGSEEPRKSIVRFDAREIDQWLRKKAVKPAKYD